MCLYISACLVCYFLTFHKNSFNVKYLLSVLLLEKEKFAAPSRGVINGPMYVGIPLGIP